MSGFESVRQAGAVVRQVTNACGLGVLFRLAYLVLLLAITLPIVFYALAAYQYQVDAAAIAEEHDLDAGQLLARAAAWNTAMHDWTALVEEGVRAAEATDTGAPGEQARAVSDTRLRQAYDDAVAALGTRATDGTAPPVPAAESGRPAAEGARLTRTLASELQRFDRLGLPLGPVWYARPSVLAELPGWALTLVVTLAAGLLGSLIFVLKAMLRQLLDNWSTGTKAPCRPRPWSWLLLRPVFGVVIALGAYVALQSGLLVIDGAMSLTPSAYVTAAVGLIAGLLSWQMIDTIENVGERWLASQRPLWAYGLDAQMKEKDRAPEELAKTLGVSDPLIGDWIAVRVPVPKDTAKRIAAELNVCPEQLFQPVPPWRRSDQQPAT